MEDYTATAINENYLNVHHWEGENIENTLIALRPHLEYRQAVARKSGRIDFRLVEPFFIHCNEEILKILHIPNKIK